MQWRNKTAETFCAPKIPVSSVGEVSTSTNTLAPFGTRNLKLGSCSPPKPKPAEQQNRDYVADIINIEDENDFDENENRAKKNRTDPDMSDNKGEHTDLSTSSLI